MVEKQKDAQRMDENEVKICGGGGRSKPFLMNMVNYVKLNKFNINITAIFTKKGWGIKI